MFNLPLCHAELVACAARWLRSCGCKTVVAERLPGGYEEPDAIGWKASGFSRVVECKASRRDFLRDAEKASRKFPDLGMGNERVYFAPIDVIRLSELPDSWGLVEVARSGRLTLRVQPKTFTVKNCNAELQWLIAYTRRREGQSKPMRPKTSNARP